MDISILDDLLLFMSKINGSSRYVDISDLFLHQPANKDLDNGIVYKALQKLIKDGYVDTNESLPYEDPFFENQRIDTRYIISFDGLVFLSQGGYYQATLENQKKQNAYVDLQNEQRRQSASLVRLNRWIVFGAIVVAIDSILNILKFFGVAYCV